MKTKNRFDEFSLLKAISIMGLPFVHLMSEALNQNISEEALNNEPEEKDPFSLLRY